MGPSQLRLVGSCRAAWQVSAEAYVHPVSRKGHSCSRNGQAKASSFFLLACNPVSLKSSKSARLYKPINQLKKENIWENIKPENVTFDVTENKYKICKSEKTTYHVGWKKIKIHKSEISTVHVDSKNAKNPNPKNVTFFMCKKKRKP